MTARKVDELIGKELDRAVGIALGYRIDEDGDNRSIRESSGAPSSWKPSNDWRQGGPIIEQECIAVEYSGGMWWALHGDTFSGNWPSDGPMLAGPTLLAAAMRAYVTSRFGATIELPD